MSHEAGHGVVLGPEAVGEGGEQAQVSQPLGGGPQLAHQVQRHGQAQGPQVAELVPGPVVQEIPEALQEQVFVLQLVLGAGEYAVQGLLPVPRGERAGPFEGAQIFLQQVLCVDQGPGVAVEPAGQIGPQGHWQAAQHGVPAHHAEHVGPPKGGHGPGMVPAQTGGNVAGGVQQGEGAARPPGVSLLRFLRDGSQI